MKPKTSVYIATSVDGFIARPDGGLDWLEHDSGNDDYGFHGFIASVDSMILGRATYEQVLGSGVEWPYTGKHVIVPSTTLSAGDVPEELRGEVEIASGEPSELLAILERQGFKHAYVDGGVTIQRFLRAGMIDELTITYIPVLIGDGIPLFGALDGDIKVRHLSTNSFDSGIVQSLYQVAR
ncbi:MAG: dihydrofolate reductase family protein [Chloroflexi bacterium]|nr:dihydrofolate reductase family protein [Chloroflexota bacterium]